MDKKKQIKTVKHCTLPWTWALITTDGDVRVCCFSNTSIGNLNQVNSIDDLWNSESFIKHGTRVYNYPLREGLENAS